MLSREFTTKEDFELSSDQSKEAAVVIVDQEESKMFTNDKQLNEQSFDNLNEAQIVREMEATIKSFSKMKPLKQTQYSTTASAGKTI